MTAAERGCDGADPGLPERLSRRRRLLGVGAWAVFGAFAIWFLARLIPNLALRLQFEDQLIVLRYARNLAEGNGLVYNIGERVMGFTTPLFTVLSSVFVIVGGDQAAAWQNGFGLLCMLGTAALAARLLVRLGAGPAAPLAVALVTFNPAAAYNYLHVGMEVHLFTLLFLLALDHHLNDRATAAGITSALLFLTRPEGVLLTAMLIAHGWLRDRRPPVRQAAAALAAALPWILFATLYYGSPMPATLSAKAGSFLIHTPRYIQRVAEIHAEAASSVVATYSPSLGAKSWAWLPLAVLVASGCVALLRRCQAIWPLVAFPVCSAVGYGVLGAWPEFTWHYYPVSVLCSFLIALGAWAVTSRVLRLFPRSGPNIRSTIPPGAGGTPTALTGREGWALVALTAVALPVLKSTCGQVNYRFQPDPWSEEHAAMGRALGERYGPTTSVLVDHIGHVGWTSGLRIVDRAGLVTPGLRYDVPRDVVIRRHQPDLLLLRNDVPTRQDVGQTAAFPFIPGYRRVPEFPTAPGYGLYRIGAEGIGDSGGGYRYDLQRDETGHVAAILLESGPDSEEPRRRFAVTGPSDGTVGYIESVRPATTPSPGSGTDYLTLSGWAADTRDPTGFMEAVLVLGDETVGSAPTDLARSDVAAQLGRPFEYSGFSLAVTADRERVGREGFIGYGLSRRGVASRLDVHYEPLTTDESGRETLPISDGRRLILQGPGGGFDGSVDLVTGEDDQTEIAGWAADLERTERPREIVVYRDSEFLISLGANRERPDVAEAFGDERLLRTGFRGTVPGAPDPDTFSRRHRVFALTPKGVAVELPHLDRQNAP